MSQPMPESLYREIDRAILYSKRVGYVEAMRDPYWDEHGKRMDDALDRYWRNKAEQVFPWPTEEDK